jgi:hypothetical protein
MAYSFPCKVHNIADAFSFTLSSILMMYANLGNIDTYITARHSMPEDGQTFDVSGQADSEAEPLSKDEMKKLFRRRRLSSRAGEGLAARRQDVRGILLFSREEIESLFGDILEGLEFLASRTWRSLTAIFRLLNF